mmetsp:Transcript_11236/g.21922  ORF Transcript_11236/g.21922 Transcript_11236/m.21922 type:complete len:242 (-) Transcript_11236:3385-4110(-)
MDLSDLLAVRLDHGAVATHTKVHGQSREVAAQASNGSLAIFRLATDESTVGIVDNGQVHVLIVGADGRFNGLAGSTYHVSLPELADRGILGNIPGLAEGVKLNSEGLTPDLRVAEFSCQLLRDKAVLLRKGKNHGNLSKAQSESSLGLDAKHVASDVGEAHGHENTESEHLHLVAVELIFLRLKLLLRRGARDQPSVALIPKLVGLGVYKLVKFGPDAVNVKADTIVRASAFAVHKRNAIA